MRIKDKSGKQFQGTPIEILIQMREISHFPQETLGSYLEWVRTNLFDQYGEDAGGYADQGEQAANLIGVMLKLGLVTTTIEQYEI